MNIRVMIFAPRVLEMRLVTTLRTMMIRRLLALGCVATAAAWANGAPASGTLSQAKTEVRYGADQALVYKQVDGRDLHLHLFKPANWKAEDRRPTVVWFHGGGWVVGNPSTAKPMVDAMRSHGFVIATVEYRRMSRDPKLADPATCIEDAKSAIRFVRAHARELGIDGARVAAAGASAGGHLAAACAFLSSFDAPKDDVAVSCRPDAMVMIVPVLDNGPEGYRGDLPVIRANVKAYSPAHSVAKGGPPTVIFAGREDPTAKLFLIERFRARMQELGNDCELHVYPGVHRFQLEPAASADIYAKTAAFFGRLGWLSEK